MKKSNPNADYAVTVVVPTRNAESTIVKNLEAISRQQYPVKEVILVDNVSSDNTVTTAKKFAKKHPELKIRFLVNNRDIMVAGSFNRGIRAARTPYIVTMHGDCCFATENELKTLMMPILKDKSIIATYGIIENPLAIWRQYNFWEKCLLAVHAGVPTPGLVGKIDCYQKKTLLTIGGYDALKYKEIGGEDADLHLRLREQGKIVETTAKVLHLHYLDKHFKLIDWITKKKNTARTYGRLLRIHGLRMGIKGVIAFLFKPILAITVLIPGINFLAIPMLVVFQFWYYRKMFMAIDTLLDPRIILVPFIGIFLLYYETFWIIEAFLRRIK